MNPTAVEVLESKAPGAAVLAALQELFSSDGLLLQIDANERSVAYRLAMYLQRQLPQLHVDCEYNRDGVDPKRIQHLYLEPNAEDTEAKTAFPDIIAHIRGTQTNYLVIELKKSTNTVPRDTDLAKLRGYKRNLNYEFALFIELVAGGEPDISRAEWIDA